MGYSPHRTSPHTSTPSEYYRIPPSLHIYGRYASTVCRLEISPSWPSHLASIAQDCTAQSPALRPSAAEVRARVARDVCHCDSSVATFLIWQVGGRLEAAHGAQDLSVGRRAI